MLFEVGRLVHASFVGRTGEAAFAALIQVSQRESQAAFRSTRRGVPSWPPCPRPSLAASISWFLSIAAGIDEGGTGTESVQPVAANLEKSGPEHGQGSGRGRPLSPAVPVADGAVEAPGEPIEDSRSVLSRLAAVPGVTLAVLVDREGFLIESAGDLVLEAEAAGALAGCLAEASEAIGRELGQGTLVGLIARSMKPASFS